MRSGLLPVPVLIPCAAISIAGAAFASPSPISHERIVESRCEVQVTPDDERELDVGLAMSDEDGVLDTESEASLAVGGSLVQCTATQDSFFSPDSIRIAGGITGDSSNDGDLFLCQAAPVSHAVYWFEVDEVTSFRFTGRFDTRGGGTVVMRLDAAFGGDTVILEFAQAEDIIEFDHVGELEPGTYKLRVQATAYVWPDTAQSASFSIEGSFGDLPCAVDLAEPIGVLNFFDLGAFLTQFNAQDPAADLAAPAGVFNFFDLGEFLSLFNQGCP